MMSDVHEVLNQPTEGLEHHPDKPLPARSSAGAFMRLPPELVELVAIHSDCSSNCSLRETCRWISQCTFQFFTSSCLPITTVNTDLSSASLRKFQTLSNTPELAPRVKKIVFHSPKGKDFAHDIDWKRKSPDQDELLPLEYYVDRRHDLRVGDLYLDINQHQIQQWRGMLGRLKNCTDFEIHHGYSENSYKTDEFLEPIDAIMLVFSMIMDTGLTMRSFCLSCSPKNPESDTFRRGINNCRATYRSNFTMRYEFYRVWAKLESFTVKEGVLGQHDWDYLQELLRRTPRLQTLDVDFSWSKKSCFFLEPASFKSDRFHLKSLYLSQMTAANSHDIIEVLEPHRQSLQNITIRGLSLQADGYRNFIKALSRGFPALKEVSFKRIHNGGHFGIAAPGNPLMDLSDGLSFKIEECQGCMDIAGVSYSGPNMKAALEMIAANIEFPNL